ncbi:MAG: hypothetical protein K2X01_11195 [Cyanobacteria bacterium]|nr:hypothetical protein [Cyanobacteriota bacterium]
MKHSTHFPSLQEIQDALQRIMADTPDAYAQLNSIRSWVNNNLAPEFELYLEDVWNDHVSGETHFEYILRSRRTLNETPALGYDIYLNHQDAKGVWHLDAYQTTVNGFPEALETLLAFIQANRA